VVQCWCPFAADSRRGGAYPRLRTQKSGIIFRVTDSEKVHERWMVVEPVHYKHACLLTQDRALLAIRLKVSAEGIVVVKVEYERL